GGRGVVAAELPEVEVGAADGVRLGEVAGGEGARGGGRVERVAPGDDAAEVPPREVLPEQQEAVAEVEVRLARVALRERAAAEVVGLARGLDADAPARALQPPAQVDLLHVHHEALVEQADLVEGGAAEEEGGAGGPEDVARVVVLPLVAFHR